MSKTEKAPSAATLEAAGMETAGNVFPCGHFTTSGGSSQDGKIFSLLLEGEENALPAADLALLAGYKNQRSMRMAIDREREIGLPLLATEAGYFRPSPGHTGVAEVKRFLRRQDARAASNRRTTRLIRARLCEIEHSPLPGQQNLFDGGGGNG